MAPWLPTWHPSVVSGIRPHDRHGKHVVAGRHHVVHLPAVFDGAFSRRTAAHGVVAQDDPVVAAELPIGWRTLLDEYVPEPFRNLG